MFIGNVNRERISGFTLGWVVIFLYFGLYGIDFMRCYCNGDICRVFFEYF